MSTALPPAAALAGHGRGLPALPACVHYAGTERFLRKALALQAERGPVFDITGDCEDGAPEGEERAHARMVAGLIASEANRHDRMGARTHGIRHPAWQEELDILVREAGTRLAYLVVPKSESADDVERYLEAVHLAVARVGLGREIPVSVLIETPAAVHDAWRVAALPGVLSLDFGTLDFVSAHHGAIPSTAMVSPGQFDHALMRHAKAATAAAALAHGVVPVHGVSMAIDDPDAVYEDARRARDEFGFMRMWSIHPSQIEQIVFGMQPDPDAVIEAASIVAAARDAQWGAIAFGGRMHDRASYRYYWSILQRARATGAALPEFAQAWFAPA